MSVAAASTALLSGNFGEPPFAVTTLSRQQGAFLGESFVTSYTHSWPLPPAKSSGMTTLGVINGPGQRSLFTKWSACPACPGCAATQRALTLRLLCTAPCSTVPSIRRQAEPLTPRTSLARASGPCTAALVSLLIVCGHFCFAYAQLTGQAQDCPGYAAGNGTGCPQSFAGSDGLAKIIMYADVEYEARGWVASALGLAEERVCHTSCPHGNQTSIPAGEGAAESVCGLLSCDTCVALFGVGAEQACNVNLHQYLLHMSYLYSVDHLWGQARLNICIRVQCGGRHASIYAYVCSVGAGTPPAYRTPTLALTLPPSPLTPPQPALALPFALNPTLIPRLTPTPTPTLTPHPRRHSHQDESVTCQLGTEPSCTGIYPGRPAAACLIVFSFIW